MIRFRRRKTISMKLLEDTHHPIKVILEKITGNIVKSKELEISSASNKTVFMGDAPAVLDMEGIPVATGKDK